MHDTNLVDHPAEHLPIEADRPLKPALLRGWRQRCPSCGKGRLFTGYLKVRPACTECGLDLTPQRADDGPAYLTILIVGHLLAPVMLWAYFEWRPDPVVLSAILATGCVALSLYLLPRIKGALIALQWANRMHGFGGKDLPGNDTDV